MSLSPLWVRVSVLAAVVAALGLGAYGAFRPGPNLGVTDPGRVATDYVNQLAKANGIIVEKESVQAVRATGTSAVVLVRLRFHQVFFGLRTPTQEIMIRVREQRSLYSVATSEIAG